ncbi:MAG: DUF547 domain-containing protein [Putridiphycobacter sp.]|nr:DUF547 domain-containing protein [Putridiphycobacter sp.]
MSIRFHLFFIFFSFLACTNSVKESALAGDSLLIKNEVSQADLNVESVDSIDGIIDAVEVGHNSEHTIIEEAVKTYSDNQQIKSKPLENQVSASEKTKNSELGRQDIMETDIVPDLPQPTNVPLKPNHTKWDELLRKYVTSSGKVNYVGLKSKLGELEEYIIYLQSFASRETWTTNEKLAYWINLYNAATVRLILENYPVSSITDIDGGKPWDQPIVKVGTKYYTLNNIENDIIRPRFKDARIHFAVNCAAKSCPPLMSTAFTAEKLNRQLQSQTAAFINSTQNTITSEKIEISKIFDWYKDDFESGDVITFLNIYSSVPINDNASISYKVYDWSLNQ